MDFTKVTEDCGRELKNAAALRNVIRYFALEFEGNKIKLQGTNIVFEGSDINNHLKSCVSCALFAVTVGFEVDGLIKRTQLENMVKAVILDKLANDAVERLSKDVLLQIEMNNLFTTSILSPGYGDFSIIYQRQILDVLEAYKRCGITATERGVLIPAKSMTGVVGISCVRVEGLPRGCANCGLVNCGQRKAEFNRRANLPPH